MTNPALDEYLHAIHSAQNALRAGDSSTARQWAQKAAQLDPDKEDPWLILAAVASPRASIEYLNRALQINPTSQRARRGMHWAVKRLRTEEAAPAPQPVLISISAESLQPHTLARKRPAVVPWLLILLALFLGIAGWASFPAFYPVLSAGQPRTQAQLIEKATRTVSPIDAFSVSSSESPTQTLLAIVSETSTPTTTFTETPLPTNTETPTLFPVPSNTPSPIPSNTPEPVIPVETEVPPNEVTATEPPEPTLGPNGRGEFPDVKADERWIDVDLSQQRVYAYEGDQIVDTFRVSTGTSRTPTVTGQYHIYVKYRAANMSGPGYFLPDVPYVMYFYKGYGLHGTYWHSNFGTPMSHGCVNLKTKEARWLFDWATVGTLVYVHR